MIVAQAGADPALFDRLDSVLRPDAILAAGSPGADIDALAAATGHPDRVLALHLTGPDQPLRLLEVGRGAATSDRVLATALALAKSTGKVAVVARAGPGLIGERMLAARQAAADQLIAEGAAPEDLDRALFDFGFPVEPPPSGAPLRSDIQDRLLAALINEGARILEEGVARQSSDIDMVWVTGYGFPAFRGGPLFHADQLGLPAMLERVRAVPGLKPAALLERLAAAGKAFADAPG